MAKLRNPFTGSDVIVEKTKLERNVTLEDTKGATIVDSNDYYNLYSNGLLVRKTVDYKSKFEMQSILCL